MIDKVITIDGPAASGKSSVSRELAKRIGWKWVSTGAYYRGLGYAALHTKTDPKDESNLVKLVHNPIWKVMMLPEFTQVLFDGQDVSLEIHAESVGGIASIISQHPKVRAELLPLQRGCASNKYGLIAEGRDCGSVVFPDAALKIYLTAHSQNRAERRAKEQGIEVDSILSAQKQRDSQDAGRAVAPLQIPKGAEVVDTSSSSLAQVIDEVEKLIRLRMKSF